MKTAITIIIGIVIVLAAALFVRSTGAGGLSGNKDNKEEKNDKNDDKDKKDSKKKSKRKDQSEQGSSNVQILNNWDLPEILKEVSDITYLDNNRFAAVQDEQGTIYIYNTSTKKIEKEVQFAGKGDYEGIAVVGKDAFILRADGRIFEVQNYLSAVKNSVEHKTHLTVENDVEGLCFDSKNSRLLLAIKGPEEGEKNYKGIYGFDLKTRKLAEEPVYRIDLKNAAFANFEEKDLSSVMRPSAIAIHPGNDNIYITEGTTPKLLVMDRQGNILSVERLSKKDFYQPEGLTFDTDGRMFISNEGNKDPGNILEVKTK